MNNDSISRSALIKAFHELINKKFAGTYDFEKLINNAPTVPLPDFKEGYKQAIIDGKTNFSRPEGEWKHIIEEDNDVECPFCGFQEDGIYYNFCPGCGARLKVKGDES